MLKIVSIDEAVEFFGVSKRTLQRSPQKYNGFYQKGVGKGGKVLRFKIEVNETLATPTTPKKAVKALSLPPISDDKKRAALDKLELIKKYQALKDENLDSQTILNYLKQLFKSSLIVDKITYRNLKNWEKSYNEQGFNALCDKRGNYEKRFFKEFDSELLKELFLSQGFSGDSNYSSLYIAYHQFKLDDRAFFEFNRHSKKKSNPYALFSYASFRRWIVQYAKDNPDVAYLVKYGNEKYRGRFAPSMGTQAYSSGANQIWQIDATNANFFVQDQDGGIPYKPKIYTVFDVYSQRVVMTLSKAQSGDDIAFAIARAMNKLGIPKTIKADNGKEFKNQQLELFCAHYGIDIDYALPFEPHEKGFVERAHKIQDLAFRLTVGYAGKGIVERKVIDNRAQKWEKDSKAQIQLSDFLTIEEALINLESQVAIYESSYNESLQTTPLQKWNESEVRPLKIEESELAYWLGKRYERQITKQGLSLDGKTYKSVNKTFINSIGHKVVVAKDITDENKVYVFDINGFAICEAYIEHESFTPKAFAQARRYGESRAKEHNKYIEVAHKNISKAKQEANMRDGFYALTNAKDTLERLERKSLKNEIAKNTFIKSAKENQLAKEKMEKRTQTRKNIEDELNARYIAAYERSKKVSGG